MIVHGDLLVFSELKGPSFMSIENTNLNDVAQYYSAKLAEHGETPLGVDWNGEEGQALRFEQLCKVITGCSFSLLDLGCGYGALLEYLRSRFDDVEYLGCDLSADMIKAARKRHGQDLLAQFSLSSEPCTVSDYSIASGIFNVRLQHNDDQWQAYLESTLDTLNRTSTKGFAFNCLTSYSDRDKMRDYLYYADPLKLFDLCKRRYSRNVALLHDYGLFEFTVLVRKE
jgi:SAM-dependent methyltransferase